ncbi:MULTISPECIES: alpha/beta hydrolase [Aerosakkonema]|uniref:alpha/beta hydrolase n=1 Tax=Aerosakkonema TaxID=1246629 RepID=UPI0035BB7892
MTHPILDRPDILQVIFHPRRDYNLPSNIPAVYPVAVEVEPGVAVTGRLHPASTDSPAILYFHGNGEIAADYDELAQIYVDLGITLLVMDYRGYGSSDGKPTASNLLSDAVTVFDAVGEIFQSHYLSPKQFYVMGRSLGSAAAIEVARYAGDRLAGLIIESGFADTFALLSRFGVKIKRAEEERDGCRNAFKLSQITTRTLIIHGQNDVLIPVEDALELHRSSAAQDKEILLISKAGHNNLMVLGMDLYFEAIQNFLGV